MTTDPSAAPRADAGDPAPPDPTDAPRLVLASGSPRRAAYLAQLGLEFEIDPALVPEDLLPGEGAEGHVIRLASEKARAVASRHPGALVLGGDTVVILDGAVLGKPATPDEAVGMLRRLSGRTHEVVTGLAVATPGGAVLAAAESATVTFRPLTPGEARAYVATGEPMDKAGAYGIQGRGAALVERVEGDYYAVVGLPLARLVDLLARAGWTYTFHGLARST